MGTRANYERLQQRANEAQIAFDESWEELEKTQEYQRTVENRAYLSRAWRAANHALSTLPRASQIRVREIQEAERDVKTHARRV